MSTPIIKEFLKLKEKYLNGTATPADIQLLEQYYDLFAEEPDIIGQLAQSEIEVLENRLKDGITNKINLKENKTIPFYKGSMMRAAAILIFILAGTYFVYNRYHKQPIQVAQNKSYKTDIAPGGNKAILTLANGSKLILNNAKNGNISTQGGANIIKQDSLISYKAIAAGSSGVSYNTITIPNGGQYQLILADGTKVWLNAASSLRFPTAFTGNNRTVELTGEAYFEVAKNKEKPFNVKTATQTVQVLGTHFNVNAYNNEAYVKTTLLEGSVKVYSANVSVTISPGQQSVLKSNGSFEIKHDLDMDEAVAWKNGMFQFNEADIQTVMRQISRWYDIDVEFKGKLPADLYRGKISRNVNVSQVLKILELSGINFTIEGRKIIVRS
ncbi:FecR family protein [Mucilaginibacter gotjawali]|uniref:Fec operon regulator FecR n=2 Tax=Mucilaginibacter gotjawali TaxID=1550579 RepID=A0A120MZ41_9SPHI|nr:FecR family protein [Mucilaginibacter gotjawali]MBB3058181.1 ferric-dicitrate binding protein FerR (iron transport regulator) [Mucilaginibacter gotjawali]BAU54863.1 fec operon regulator FecR [Mucilaginibacter gotjawali]